MLQLYGCHGVSPLTLIVVERCATSHHYYPIGVYTPLALTVTSHLREEVVDMPITITLHIFGYTVTIRIKGENRHPGVAAHKTGFEKQILWQLLDNGC